METFHWLPIELKFEVLIHLDCRTLVRILNLYQYLKANVVIIYDTDDELEWFIAEPQLLKTLLPGVRWITLKSMPASLPTHTYLKIVDFPFDNFSTSNGVPYEEYRTRTDEVTLIRRNSWIKLLTIMDRYTTISWAGSREYCETSISSEWILQMVCSITGASFHPLFLLWDEIPGTPARRIEARRSALSPFSPWLRLSSIKVTVETTFKLENMPRVEKLSVEFTTLGRIAAPVLEVNSTPCLEHLRVLYHGELVPWITVKTFSQPPDDRWDPPTTFQLTRLHSQQLLTPTNPATALLEMNSYKGNLSLLGRCSKVSFSGIPDWFIHLGSYTDTTDFKWNRTDPTKVLERRRRVRSVLAELMPDLQCLRICSMIRNDTIPFITRTNSSIFTNRPPAARWMLDLLELTVGAPGLNLDGFLSQFCSGRFRILGLPLSKTLDTVGPNLSLSFDNLCEISTYSLEVKGDIDLSGLVFNEREFRNSISGAEKEQNGIHLGAHHHRYYNYGLLDIDLGATARYSPHNMVDLKCLPLGSRTIHSEVVITCPVGQPIKLALHKSSRASNQALNTGGVYNGQPYIPSWTYPELSLDWHIIYSTTFEGEPIVRADFDPPIRLTSNLPLAHFLFDGVDGKYVFCNGACFDCFKALCDLAV